VRPSDRIMTKKIQKYILSLIALWAGNVYNTCCSGRKLERLFGQGAVMASISIRSGEFSHLQAWTRRPLFAKRYFVYLVLCAVFADGVCVCARQTGVCEKTVRCLREASRRWQLLLKRLSNGVRGLLPWWECVESIRYSRQGGEGNR
jgi:hypothetical protein